MRNLILPAAAAMPLLARFMALAACGAALSACSLTIPMPGLTPNDDVTGSIRRTPPPLAKDLDAEDWRRAKSALGTALDPQGNGASVAWDNPVSGAKGSFVALAQPYPKDDGICRAFAARLSVGGAPERLLRSSACRANGGDWLIGAVETVPATVKTVSKPSKNLAERDTNTQLR